MDKVYRIKIREEGGGYKKGSVVTGTFHGCQVADDEKGQPVEIALVTLQDGELAGQRVGIPFKAFRFVESESKEEASNESQA